MRIGNKVIGTGRVYIIGEIGINHNGDKRITEALIREAAKAGIDAVKFQARTPVICVPREMWDKPKETPWGNTQRYIDYRKAMEFTDAEWLYAQQIAHQEGLDWFTSFWDAEVFKRVIHLFPDMAAIKIPSAAITDHELLQAVSAWQSEFGQDTPVIMSTGGSTREQISKAVNIYPWTNLILMHCTSEYPCPDENVFLREIESLSFDYQKENVQIGYSNHSPGIIHTVSAVALGASVVEVHITLDRSMFGSDHAASIEPVGLQRLVKYIRASEKALKERDRITSGEHKAMEKLRRVK
jgi:sialic acid synthase SpsE